MARSRRLLTVVGGLVALGLTGCGGGEVAVGAPNGVAVAAPAAAAPASAGSPVEVVAASADTAREAGAARLRLESVSSTPSGEVRVTADGVVDNADGTAALTLTPQLPPDAANTGTPAVGPIEVRLVDGAVYVRGVPGQAEGTWLRQPVPALAQSGVPGNPTESLALLRSAVDVAEAGTADVRGEQTTRYTGTIDVAAVLEQTADENPAAAQAVEQLRAAGIEQVPFEVFLDSQGRPVRLVQTLEITAAGTPFTTTTTLDLYDWGTEVDVQAPDPASVVDAPAPAATSPAATSVPS